MDWQRGGGPVVVTCFRCAASFSGLERRFLTRGHWTPASDSWRTGCPPLRRCARCSGRGPSALEDKLFGHDLGVAQSAFGRESDIRALGRRFIERGLQASRSDAATWRLSPWACELRRLSDKHRARLVVAELPMPDVYDVVRHSSEGKRLRLSLPADFCGLRLDWLDVSGAQPPGGAHFPDGLHVDQATAQAISRRIGCELASPLRASPREGARSNPAEQLKSGDLRSDQRHTRPDGLGGRAIPTLGGTAASSPTPSRAVGRLNNPCKAESTCHLFAACLT